MNYEVLHRALVIVEQLKGYQRTDTEWGKQTGSIINVHEMIAKAEAALTEIPELAPYRIRWAVSQDACGFETLSPTFQEKPAVDRLGDLAR